MPEFSEEEGKIFTLNFKNEFVKKLENLYKIFGKIKKFLKIIKSLRK